MANVYFELTREFNDQGLVAVLGKLRRDGVRSDRPAARAGDDREAVAVALAREANALQVRDAQRVARYVAAARPYVRAFQRDGLGGLALRRAHAAALDLAARLLPERPGRVEA